jgi:ectoine hydroxylase-related dioxygenase (phytanoyl-CoA dioxygenase family)
MQHFPDVDFSDYHREVLPGRLAAGHLRAAAPGLDGLPSIAIRIAESGESARYVPRAGDAPAIGIYPDDAGAELVVRLGVRAWSGLVHDVETPASLVYHGEVEAIRGDLMDFVRWEPVLRAMYTGRPVYDPAAVDLRDRRGAPLDPARGFTLAEIEREPEEAAHFLRVVGYLLVKGVFSPDEVEAFRSAAAALREAARPDDRASWWARDAAGAPVLCRVLRGGTQPVLRALKHDPRIARVVALADEKLVAKQSADEPDGVTVLWKNPGVREGLSDLPWHRDCGMGGHASMCPTLVASVFLEANTPEAGALRFLPASWRASYRFAEADGAAEAAEAGTEPGLIMPAEPGDFTVHYGDGWHAAPPPTSDTGPFRCSVLLSFEREGAFNHRGERHYNDVLLGDEQGQVQSMRTRAGRG